MPDMLDFLFQFQDYKLWSPFDLDETNYLCGFLRNNSIARVKSFLSSLSSIIKKKI